MDASKYEYAIANLADQVALLSEKMGKIQTMAEATDTTLFGAKGNNGMKKDLDALKERFDKFKAWVLKHYYIGFGVAVAIGFLLQHFLKW